MQIRLTMQAQPPSILAYSIVPKAMSGAHSMDHEQTDKALDGLAHSHDVVATVNACVDVLIGDLIGSILGFALIAAALLLLIERFVGLPW